MQPHVQYCLAEKKKNKEIIVRLYSSIVYLKCCIGKNIQNIDFTYEYIIETVKCFLHPHQCMIEISICIGNTTDSVAFVS